MNFWEGILTKLVIEWHEREHEVEDDATLKDANAVNALRNCRILKFFKIPNMRAQKPFLRRLIDY